MGKIVVGKILTTYRRILHPRQNNPDAAVLEHFEPLQPRPISLRVCSLYDSSMAYLKSDFTQSVPTGSSEDFHCQV
ncbi:hypothetical protein GALMADRAFT_1230608 [Galerina marginata CBS 339.88]|uniref:Uncharacterized protein n=1 Tax=Galerina marginata (strain CBS 339.88) TaxID=685588 RepID=A0A067TJV0_GALM3|nr:hypothetical protein GALMADRAFT_1230608 [Galerina marginata CBS 339.88]